MKIFDVMTENVKTCRANDDLTVPAMIMLEHDCGAVPVVDSHGRVVGMITDRDICMACLTQGRPPHDVLVDTAASHKAHCVRENDAVEDAEELMARARVRRLPVVDDDGRPVGIVSLKDIAQRATYDAAQSGDGIAAIGVARTLAAIGGPAPADNAAG